MSTNAWGDPVRTATTDDRVLRDIQAADPDGHDYGAAGPTEADYARFRSSVIAAYGETAWNDYNGTAWAGQPEW